ncbi:adenylate kinase [Candidatus Woesebacteria bacterium]|nr:MAG: adenylate kinase [Candidatus Woesebacteria bacterium]
MNIIILGPQGSGKGTQAKLLAKKLDLLLFETGKFLRELAKTDKSIDERINKRGELLPDEEVFSLVSNHLNEKAPTAKNILLDGYPRSVKQYELLEDWLKQKDAKIDKAILLEISEKESIRRLSARRTCNKCGQIYNLITNLPPADGCPCGGSLTQREDDMPESIKKRLAAYNKVTKPLVKRLESQGILEKVDGERPIETIFKDILSRTGENINAKK